MSEYSSLKATINANVKTNGNQEITGSIMNSVLNAMVDSLGAGYQFMGVATPTNSGSAQAPDYKCFYLATTPGTYTNLGGLVVADGEVAILKYDTSWTKEVTGIASADKLNQLGQKVSVFVSGNSSTGIKFQKKGYYWHLVADADSVGISINGVSVNNVATDIALTGTWKNITVDSSGNIYAEDTIPDNHYCIGRVLSLNPSVNSLQCPYNIGGAQYGVQSLLIASRPENITFKKISNSWHLVIPAGYANVYFSDGTSKNNTETDLTIPTGWQNIYVDKNGGFSISTTPILDAFCVARLYSTAQQIIVVGTHFPYNIEGRPYNIGEEITFGFALNNNEPIIPNELYVLDDAETPLYRSSMLLKPNYDCDMVLSTTISDRRKMFDIKNPLRISYDNIGDTARITLEKNSELTTNVFKELIINKGIVTNKAGKTPKIIMIGDSITHGNNGAQSSPIVKVNELLPVRYSVNPSMIGTFAPYGVPGEGRGCFSFLAMAGVDNNPFGRYHFPSVGGNLEGTTPVTTQFQNPFTFPATSADKTNHPEWCFTNNNNYPDEPDGLSYANATSEQRNNLHFFIFDFTRYVNLWGDVAHTPDIITIALGTNDWWPSSAIDIEKTMFAIDIVYQQIRNALPNVKIGFVSANNIATTFQNDLRGNWETEIAPLLANIQKKIATWRVTDVNVHEIPIFANGCRWLAFDGATASAPQSISNDNNVQKQTIDANVHLLDGIGSDGYWEYMDAIATAIVCLID